MHALQEHANVAMINEAGLRESDHGHVILCRHISHRKLARRRDCVQADDVMPPVLRCRPLSTSLGPVVS